MYKKIVAIGVFPPPHTGQSAAFESFCDQFLEGCERINVSGGIKGGYRLRKAWYYIKAFLYLSTKRKRMVYYTLNSGSGLYLDLLLLASAKIFGHEVLLHHHSYGYINTKSYIIKLLCNILRKDCMIFLSRKMMDDFNNAYFCCEKSFTLNNIFQYSSSESQYAIDSKNGKLKVGFLSNITLDKGFDRICEVVERTLDLPVEYYLAGPVDREAEEYFKCLPAEIKDRVHLTGAIYGNDKKKYFKSLDFFIFPTRYDNEAQPMVIVEALQYSIPVISNNRGTILDLLGNDFPPVGDYEFVSKCSNKILTYCHDYTKLDLDKRLAAKQYITLKEQSAYECKLLKEVLVETHSHKS
jgi:glycosyltransferase involved in cell wall biosynthesis